MDISKMIKRMLLECDSTAADMAARLGTSRANASQRLKRNTWSVADLEQIADVYGCGLVVGFVLPDGETIMQTIPAHDATSPSSTPASTSPADPADASGNA